MTPRSDFGMTAIGAATCFFLAAACSQEVPQAFSPQLDRPVDVAFGCLSTEGDAGVRAVPLSQCRGSGSADAGVDAGAPAPHVAFVVESARGTVSVASLSSAAILDSDTLIPGVNGIPVGLHPVGIATSSNGCFAVTANWGSCDLGVVDVLAAVQKRPSAVRRAEIRTPRGRLAARPAAIVAWRDPAADDASSCDAGAGVLYVAFPRCRLVAAVQDGEVVAGIRFSPTGASVVPPSDVACEIECAELGEGAATSAPGAKGALEPSVLALSADGSRLFVAGGNRPDIQVVPLASGLPSGDSLPSPLSLEGAVGIRRLAVSPEIEMGNGGEGGTFQFLYAVGRDAAVHVADVRPGTSPAECETQADPRSLRAVRDVATLACVPIRDVRYPRRADARGPGVRLPDGATPLDVAFFTASEELSTDGNEGYEARALKGTFGLISAQHPRRGGIVYYVNIDDENYSDVENAAFKGDTDIVLATPHALRDGLNRPLFNPSCSAAEPPSTTKVDPVRLAGNKVNREFPEEQQGEIARRPWLVFGDATTTPQASRLLPLLHRVKCPDQENVTWSLGGNAPHEVREDAFPDIARVLDYDFDDPRMARPNERWTVRWQGAFAVGVGAEVRPEGETMTFKDPSGPFCEQGIEENDIVELVGCDADTDCAVGEICQVFPGAPDGVNGRLCLPKARANELSITCKELLTTVRRYTAVEVKQDEMVLVPRPVAPGWSPLPECVDDTQCSDIYLGEKKALETADGRGLVLPEYSWGCLADATFGGKRKCVMTCNATSECAPSTACVQGRCVLGPIPPSECLSSVQRYAVRSGDAFTVLSSELGYLHRREVDPATRQCVTDATRRPYLVGRFRKDEPECSPGLDEPNPCRLDFEEPYVITETVDGVPGTKVLTRRSHGVRLRTPGVTFDIADVVIPFVDENGAPKFPGFTYSPAPSDYPFLFQVRTENAPEGVQVRNEQLSIFRIPDYALDLSITGGLVPMSVPAAISEGTTSSSGPTMAIPTRLAAAPDGTTWTVDTGDLRIDGDRISGQLVRLPIVGTQALIIR
ncbi:MAG: hypothetical protein HY698_03155 [Deltaproteobacteria bacterium]|nr:hypothetical protein [Deltaproteobacteria bacterium]